MSTGTTEISRAEMAKTMAAIQSGKGEQNERGIPRVAFIPDVGEFMKQHDLKVEILFENLNLLLQKYRLMMAHLQKNKTSLQVRSPQISRALQAVQQLISKAEAEEEMKTSFPLSDSVFADATVTPNAEGSVYLWLGANVMLE